jgi:hypothetical protein
MDMNKLQEQSFIFQKDLSYISNIMNECFCDTNNVLENVLELV